MRNGCKNFASPTMDKIKVEPFYEYRVNDVQFAQIKLGMAIRRGYEVDDLINLTQELREYIIYLYSHIEQLESDKQYLLTQLLRAKHTKG